MELTVHSKGFYANGHLYIIELEKPLSFERLIWASKWTAIYDFSGINSMVSSGTMGGSRLLEQLTKAQNALLEGDSEKVKRILEATMERMKVLTYKHTPSFYTCSLFINRIDEDRDKYSLEMADEKIDDWVAQRDLSGSPFRIWAKAWFDRNVN